MTRGFWGLVIVLLGASLFFGVSAQADRGAMRDAKAGLVDGSTITLERVVDGDTLLVKNDLGEPVSIRLVGVKSFPLAREAPDVYRAAREAVTQLQEILGDRSAVVTLHSTPRDSHGRFLAYLAVDEKDVGLELIRTGAVLAYTLYPFERLDSYLGAQELARASKQGLWRTENLVRRADALLLNWRMQQ